MLHAEDHLDAVPDHRGDEDAVAALSRFAAAHAGQLDSAELNPVVVRPAGQGVVALDALIVPAKTTAG
ncbi:MAG: hypothetical protein OXG35_08860 [Acidobacteria bacterium]|nr:hypothetical protein [Acidobacteriota bacterium]